MYAICMQIFPAALRDPVGPVRLQLPASRCQDQHVPRKGGIGGNADIGEVETLLQGGDVFPALPTEVRDVGGGKGKGDGPFSGAGGREEGCGHL